MEVPAEYQCFHDRLRIEVKLKYLFCIKINDFTISIAESNVIANNDATHRRMPPP